MEVDYSCTRTQVGRRNKIPRTVTVEASPPLASSEKSPLEALLPDILIKVLCGVDHDDLEQLFRVSKTIREATLVAKDLHFKYSTPKKRTFGSHDPFDLEDVSWFDEIKVPNAPVIKSRSRFNGRKLNDIMLTLSASMDDDDDGDEIKIYR